MRILLFLAVIFLSLTSGADAASSIPKTIENIDLNIKSHEMAITFLNLRDGEATLIQGPDGENILVTAGGEGILTELEDWLSLYKVKKISKWVMAGSFGEIPRLDSVISKYYITELIVPANLAGRFDLPAEVKIFPAAEGDRIAFFPDLTADFQYSGIEKNEGLDFILKFFGHQILFMHSSTSQAEQSLLKKNLGAVHIFKVPVCSTADTLLEDLIGHVNPQISILNGANQQIMEELIKTWSEIYFTKRDGTITIKFTENNYEIFTLPVENDE